MKLNLNFQLILPNGEENPNFNIGKSVANYLFMASFKEETDVIKWTELSRKLHAGKDIELDTADQKRFKELVLAADVLPNGCKKAVIDALDNKIPSDNGEEVSDATKKALKEAVDKK